MSANEFSLGAPAACTLVSSPNTSASDISSSSFIQRFLHVQPLDQPIYDPSGIPKPEDHDEQAAAFDRYWSVLIEEAIKNDTFLKIFTQTNFPPAGLALDEGETQRLISTCPSSPNFDRCTPSSVLTAAGSTITYSVPTDSLIASPSQPFDLSQSHSPSVDMSAHSPRPSVATLVHRTPKRSGKRSQPDCDVRQNAFTLNSYRPDPVLRQCLDRILIAQYYCDGELEPKQNTAGAQEILGALLPNSSRSAKSSPSIYQIFLDGKVCLMCGEKKDSTTRAIRCVRMHLNHRPFRCGGQRDGCRKCGVGNK